jgi:hypothetical protein
MRVAILSLLGFSLCVAASADEAADKDCVDATARGPRRFQVPLSRRRELGKGHPSLVRPTMTRHSHWKSK